MIAGHLNRKIYFCCYCDYGSKLRTGAKNHYLEKHRDKPERIRSDIKAHGKEIYEWIEKCFPGTKDVLAGNSTNSNWLKCKLCRANLRNSDERQHVITSHLTSHAYFCGHCDFSSLWMWGVKTHCKNFHGGKLELIKNESAKCEKEIDGWLLKCFGNE